MIQLPSALIKELEHDSTFDIAGFIAANQLPPVTSIRLNPLKTKSNPFATTANPIPWCENGYYLSERPAFIFDPLIHAGAYYVQEASSMFLEHILTQVNPQKNAVALDLCAAPGGKTTLLSSYLDNGLVIANEVIKTRASILVENATKWGSGNIIVTNNDPKQFGQLPNFFDILLIDAPCSGSGLFRRENDWAEGWSEDNVHLCSQRQQRIIADAFDTLKEDGVLIYATCSYSREEDESILDWITDNLDVENIAISFPSEWNITTAHSSNNKAEGYKFFPHLTQGEGFFVSIFKKNTTTGHYFTNTNDKKLASPTKSEIATTEEWLDHPEQYYLFKHGIEIMAIRNEWRAHLHDLQNALYLKKVGLTIGEVKAKGLVPAHDLAVFHTRSSGINCIELTQEQAILYLKRQDITLEIAPSNGWKLATYQGQGLGWIKILPNRINNYYPVDWRILKQ